MLERHEPTDSRHPNPHNLLHFSPTAHKNNTSSLLFLLPVEGAHVFAHKRPTKSNRKHMVLMFLSALEREHNTITAGHELCSSEKLLGLLRPLADIVSTQDVSLPPSKTLAARQNAVDVVSTPAPPTPPTHPPACTHISTTASAKRWCIMSKGNL